MLGTGFGAACCVGNLPGQRDLALLKEGLDASGEVGGPSGRGGSINRLIRIGCRC
jgi:hypothetical protein